MLKGSPYLLRCDAMHFVKAEGMNNFYFFQLDADGIFFIFSYSNSILNSLVQVSGLKMFMESEGVECSHCLNWGCGWTLVGTF